MLKLVHSSETIGRPAPDGFLATQFLERANAHAFGTRIPGSSVNHEKVMTLLKGLKQMFMTGENEVGMMFMRDDDLVIFIRIPSYHTAETLRWHMRKLERMLREQGLIYRAIVSHLPPPKHMH